MLTRGLLVAFLLPGALLLLAFLVVPGAWSLGQSFTSYTLLGPQATDTHFVGLRNYQRALGDTGFWNALRVSLLYVFGSAVVGQMGVGLVLALCTTRLEDRFAALVRGAAVLAWIAPGVVVAILWNIYLQPEGGTLNRLLGVQISWLAEHPLIAITLYNTWRGAAFSMLLLDAALRSIPMSYLEAAAVCGASTWQRFRDITLPLLRPQLLTDLLLITLWTLNDFGPYLLTSGGPNHQTEVIPIFTWRVAFRSFDLGYGAALSTLLLAVNLALALLYQAMLRRRAR